MSFITYLLFEPWGLLNGNLLRLDFPLNQKREIETNSLYRCLIVPDEMTIFVGNLEISPKMQSSIFFWNGKPFRRAILPIESKKTKDGSCISTIMLKHGHFTFEFNLASKNDLSSDELIKTFIRRQIDDFQEIASMPGSELLQEESMGHVIRKSWKSAQKFWLECDNTESEKNSNPIVRMARDQNLIMAFKHVLQAPNKVLKRERTHQNIASVSEMDSSCLQWYIKQPGTTVKEKAGSKQKILSISRHESYDLLENKVSRWVIDEALKLSHKYLRDNKLYSDSEKCIAVRRLEWIIKTHLTTSPISTTLPCQHGFQPNYALTGHKQYRIILNAYRFLRNQQKLEDDCWSWQVALWSETARQILGSLLTSLSSQVHPFTEFAESMIYVRKEQMHGVWTDSPTTPGPFRSQEGIIDYIDLRDGTPEKELNSWMQALGCQQLMRQYRKNGNERLIPIWFWHTSEESDEKLKSYSNECLESITISLPLLNNDDIKVKGILFISRINDEQLTSYTIENEISLIVVNIPQKYRADANILKSIALEIALFFN